MVTAHLLMAGISNQKQPLLPLEKGKLSSSILLILRFHVLRCEVMRNTFSGRDPYMLIIVIFHDCIAFSRCQ